MNKITQSFVVGVMNGYELKPAEIRGLAKRFQDGFKSARPGYRGMSDDAAEQLVVKLVEWLQKP